MARIPNRSSLIPRGKQARLQGVLSRSGANVVTTGSTWVLGHPYSISWKALGFLPDNLLDAMKEYFRFQIANGAPAYVCNQFNWLKRLFGLMQDEIVRNRSAAELSLAFFSQCQRALKENVSEGTISNFMDAYRRWYTWCVDAGFSGFDVDVAIGLQEKTIGSNAKGVAVLRHDPNEGPLLDVELDAILSKLNIATEDGLLPLNVLVAVWLMVAFGCNPKNLTWLDEADLTRAVLSDSRILFQLQIPRIKKRDAVERSQFKTRSLLPKIGRLIERLIDDNHLLSSADPLWDKSRFATPLFRRKSPNLRLVNTDFEGDAYRVDMAWFREALRGFVGYFSLRSVDERPLNLTPRRLRYTFATRLVNEGASPRELSEALDHTDLQCVMVYFNSRSDIVRSLDRAMAMKLAPYVQAFLGRVVEGEKAAVRGDDPGSRVYSLADYNERLAPLGTCGSFGICGLYAPIACYTCPKFQAWADAPHQEVLDQLLAQRKTRVDHGVDARLTPLHDQTILAVAAVVAKCSE